MKYSIFLEDINPDTGAISQIIKMCECDSAETAQQIQIALSMQDDSNPNREYIVKHYDKKENLLICISTDQLEVAWKFQLWLKDRGVRAVVCFSTTDLVLIRTAYFEHGIQHQLVIVGSLENWKGVNFDFHVGQLDPLDFESIIRSLS
jgi:hypothetical protein